LNGGTFAVRSSSESPRMRSKSDLSTHLLAAVESAKKEARTS